MNKVYVYPTAHKRVAHLPGVPAAVGGFAEGIALVANLRLMEHRTSKARHHIEVTKPNALDTEVSLVGPAALTVEVGRKEGSPSGGMSPLEILTGAIRGR